MAEDISPRVKLPGQVSRKAVAPGANSLAQSQNQPEAAALEHESPRPTNRERYENKPMPKLPHEISPPSHTSQAKPYIQPVIPLVDPAPQVKNRAVTDPIAPKALFAGRKPSVGQLRKKFGHSKQASESDKRLSPTIPYPTGKAAEVLGLSSEKPPSRSAVPSSTFLLSDYQNETAFSSHAQSDEVSNSTRQYQSTPVPVGRHSREDSQDTVDAGTRITIPQDPRDQETAAENPRTPLQDHQSQTKGNLAPPKIASYGKVGDTGVVQGQGMIRVESVRGIIENASASTSDEVAPTSATHSQHSSDFLQPVSYSPSNYGGVWENDPAVGYSLSPFSPMPRGFPPNQNLASDRTMPSQESHATTPSVFRDDYTNASFDSSGLPSGHNGGLIDRQLPFPDDRRSHLGSANSWAQENSYPSDNGPVSALLPQGWPHRLNSVPSPPHSQRDYDRPGSLAAGLSQLDMTIHHHIDTAFGQLSRLVTDKHDRVLDQVLRRVDNLEDVIGRNLKNVKSEIKGMNHEMGRMKLAINSFSKGNEDVKELMQSLNKQLGSLETQVNESQRLCQQVVTTQTTCSSESERQPRSLAHRRTESAHGAFSTSQDRRSQPNGGSRAASKMRTSKASNRSHRSNTVSSQPTNGANEERGAKREYHPDTGAVRGSVPDIRDHPAYAGIPQPATQMYDQNGIPIGLAYGVPYGTQQFGDGGWYHQAYGSG